MEANEIVECVINVFKEDRREYYRLHSIWASNKVSISVASKNGAWTGEISNSKLEETSKALNIPFEKFLSETKSALTTPDGFSGIVYSVEDNHFMWKKLIDEDAGIKIKLGAVPLQPANFAETVQSMMDVALKANRDMISQITELKNEKSFAETRINDLFAKMDVAAQSKQQREDELMSQFLTLLNSKKSRISYLEEELLKLKASAPPPTKKSKIKSRRTKSNKLKDTKTEDPYDCDTDEDMPLALPSSSALLNVSSNKEEICNPACSSTTTDEEMPSVISSSSAAPTVDHIEKDAFRSNPTVTRDNEFGVASTSSAVTENVSVPVNSACVIDNAVTSSVAPNLVEVIAKTENNEVILSTNRGSAENVSTILVPNASSCVTLAPVDSITFSTPTNNMVPSLPSNGEDILSYFFGA